MDFRRLRLDESRVIEMAEPGDTRIISCIEKWLSESHSAARRQFHEESMLTSADADNAYWFIREQYGKTAAKSAMVRFLRANGFATIRWRVLLAEVRAKGQESFDVSCGTPPRSDSCGGSAEPRKALRLTKPMRSLTRRSESCRSPRRSGEIERRERNNKPSYPG